MGSLNYALVNKDEKAQGFNLIYSLLDSKIDILDKKVRQLMERLKRKHEHPTTRLTALEGELNLNVLRDDMSYIGSAAHHQFFSEVENMSRSIYLLEHMKLGLRPENLSDVMFLLEDDKFLTVPEPHVRQLFK